MSEERQHLKEKPTKKQEDPNSSSDEGEKQAAFIIKKKADKSLDLLMKHNDSRVTRHIKRIARYIEYLEDKQSDYNFKIQTLTRKIRVLNTKLLQIREAAQTIEPKDEWEKVSTRRRRTRYKVN